MGQLEACNYSLPGIAGEALAKLGRGAHFDLLSERETEALSLAGLIIDDLELSKLQERLEVGDRLTQRENAQFRIYDAILRSQSVIPGMIESVCVVADAYGGAELPREFIEIEPSNEQPDEAS